MSPTKHEGLFPKDNKVIKSRVTEYKGDGETGTWSPITSDNPPTTLKVDKKKKGETTKKISDSATSKDSGSGSVKKKYKEIELNTLTGTLEFIATKQTIKIKAGDTIKLNGFGKHLSGKYYVQDVTRQVSSSGYTHSATVIKVDFRETLKIKEKNSKKGKKTKNSKLKSTKKVKSSSKAKDAKRTYTVKKGDSLYSIAKRFYGKGSLRTKIYDADTNKVADPKRIYVGQKLILK